MESNTVHKKPLGIGSFVSYGDNANPRKVGVLVKEEKQRPNVFAMNYEAGRFDPVGSTFRVVWPSGASSSVSQSAIDGPGGWRREPGEASPEEVSEAKTRSEQWTAARKRENEEQIAIRNAWREENRKRAALVEGAHGWIIFEIEVDDTDLMSDYFGTKTIKQWTLAPFAGKRRTEKVLERALSEFFELKSLKWKSVKEYRRHGVPTFRATVEGMDQVDTYGGGRSTPYLQVSFGYGAESNDEPFTEGCLAKWMETQERE